MPDLTIAWSPSAFAVADEAPVRLLESLGLTVRANPFGRRLTEDEAVQHVAGADGLIAGLEPLSRRVLESADRLKAIARVGIGVDNVDFVAAAECGITVSNTPEAPTAAVAELTVAAALSLLRELGPANQDMHDGTWKKRLAPGLRGTTVLLVGYGRIGRAVAKLLSPFGPRLLAADPAFDTPDGVAEPIGLAEGLAAAEVISLHAGGRDPILGAAEFRAVREGVVLLNSARAELVEESALVEALASGRVAKAWFDVFWEEPYQGPLTDFDQMLLTPHIGTYTGACRREMEMKATTNLLRDLGLSEAKLP